MVDVIPSTIIKILRYSEAASTAAPVTIVPPQTKSAGGKKATATPQAATPIVVAGLSFIIDAEYSDCFALEVAKLLLAVPSRNTVTIKLRIIRIYKILL